MSDTEILERAKDGTISAAEIKEAAEVLRLRGSSGRDPYTLIHILGASGAVRYKELVAGYLNEKDDPMLARIALQVLCSHWNMTAQYRDEVAAFIRGVEWDIDEVVRLAAVSIAGEWLRSSRDKTLLALLFDVFATVTNSSIVRQEAYFALARAYGKNWNELPPASRAMNPEKDVDPDVLVWARNQI